jgi:hypothetical protein
VPGRRRARRPSLLATEPGSAARSAVPDVLVTLAVAAGEGGVPARAADGQRYKHAELEI